MALRWRLSFAVNRQPPKIFFDFSRDTLFNPEDFRLGDFVKRLDPVECVRLNKMAIGIRDIRTFDFANNGFDVACFLTKNSPLSLISPSQKSMWTPCGQRKPNVVLLCSLLSSLVRSAVG
jgi:hypothetical protein